MNLEKVLAACIIVYLAIALPSYLQNSQAAQKCFDACSKEGFAIVISAADSLEGVQCRCLNEYNRAELNLTIR